MFRAGMGKCARPSLKFKSSKYGNFFTNFTALINKIKYFRFYICVLSFLLDIHIMCAIFELNICTFVVPEFSLRP